MDISSRITAVRKQKGWSQAELAKKLNVSREIVGRYERGDATPSIEIAGKMADVFGISLDYLAGNTEEELDKATLKRIQEVSKLSSEDKQVVYKFLDAFINNTKLQGML
jgi:transcriptional regulator with XRE-family HTH domain